MGAVCSSEPLSSNIYHLKEETISSVPIDPDPGIHQHNFIEHSTSQGTDVPLSATLPKIQLPQDGTEENLTPMASFWENGSFSPRSEGISSPRIQEEVSVGTPTSPLSTRSDECCGSAVHLIRGRRNLSDLRRQVPGGRSSPNSSRSSPVDLQNRQQCRMTHLSVPRDQLSPLQLPDPANRWVADLSPTDLEVKEFPRAMSVYPAEDVFGSLGKDEIMDERCNFAPEKRKCFESLDLTRPLSSSTMSASPASTLPSSPSFDIPATPYSPATPKFENGSVDLCSPTTSTSTGSISSKRGKRALTFKVNRRANKLMTRTAASSGESGMSLRMQGLPLDKSPSPHSSAALSPTEKCRVPKQAAAVFPKAPLPPIRRPSSSVHRWSSQLSNHP